MQHYYFCYLINSFVRSCDVGLCSNIDRVPAYRQSIRHIVTFGDFGGMNFGNFFSVSYPAVYDILAPFPSYKLIFIGLIPISTQFWQKIQLRSYISIFGLTRATKPEVQIAQHFEEISKKQIEILCHQRRPMSEDNRK